MNAIQIKRFFNSLGLMCESVQDVIESNFFRISQDDDGYWFEGRDVNGKLIMFRQDLTKINLYDMILFGVEMSLEFGEK